MKGGSPKVKDATMAKAKGDLTKANNKIEALKKELEEAKQSLAVADKTILELKEKMPSADPVKKT
jgi:predicted  nucleic acid-binding Zn-ribbon protein